MLKKKLLTMIVLLGMLVGNAAAAPLPPELVLDSVTAVQDTPCPVADPYETMGGGDRDDFHQTASTLTTAGQPEHTFDVAADKDWAKFEAKAGMLYTIATTNLTPTLPARHADTTLELYGPDGETLIDQSDDVGGTYASQLAWQAPQSDVYYVKIYNYVSTIFGCDVGYDLTLSEETALQISKSAQDLNGDPLFEKDVIRYTIVVTNPSPTKARQGVVITDAIPSGTTLVAGSIQLAPSGTWTIVRQTPVVEIRGASLASGAAVTLTFDVRVDPGTPGQQIANRAYAISELMTVPVSTPPVTTDGDGTVFSGLEAVKTAVDLNGPPLRAGDLISYTIAVTNSSPITHTNVAITDVVPAGTTFVDGSAYSTAGVFGAFVPTLELALARLAPQEVVRLGFAVSVDDGVNQVGGNSVYMQSDQQGLRSQGPVYPSPGNGEVSVLDVAKFAEDLNGGPLYEGDEIRYIVVVKNLLPITQTNVVVTDAVPAHTTLVPGSPTLSLGSLSGTDPLVANIDALPGGQSALLSFRVVVDASAAGERITNMAYADSAQQAAPVSAGPVEPEPDGGLVSPGRQSLSVTKLARDLNGGPVYQADVIEYTVVVANLLAEAQDNVVVTDAIPAHTSYVAASAELSQGSLSGPDPLVATVGTLQAGQSATLTFRVTVDASAVGQTLANSALAGSDDQEPAVSTPPVQPYPDPIQNAPDTGGGLVYPGGQQIGISKLAADLNGAPLRAYDYVEYKIIAWNLSAVTQTNVVLTDHLPLWSAYVKGSLTTTQGVRAGINPVRVNVDSLGVGARMTVTFRIIVLPSAIGHRITNVGTAGSDQQSPAALSNPAEPQPGGGQVWPYEALAVTKTAQDVDGGLLLQGDEILYTVFVTNALPVTQTGVVITDAVPSGATYVAASASVSQGSLSGPDPLVANVGELAPGQAASLSFRVTVNAGTIGQLVRNTAQAGSNLQVPPAEVGPIEPQPGGGTVQPDQALGIAKLAVDVNGGQLYAGDEIAYTVVVTNQLSLAQTGIVITDAVPAGATYVTASASISQGSLSGPDPLVANVGTLAAGQVATLTFRVTVDAGTVGQAIANSAQASSDQQKPAVTAGPVEPQPGGGTVWPEQALAIAKLAVDVNGGLLQAGDEILYTVLVTNQLSLAQTGIVVTDAVPAGATYVAASASASQGSVSGPDPLVANVGTLAAGKVATLTFRVTVDAGTVGQTIANSAQASSDQQKPAVTAGPVEPQPGGGTVQPDQALGIAKLAVDVNGETLKAGDEILYTVIVTNYLSISQTGIVVTDAVPAGATYVAASASASQGSLSGPDPLVANVGTLAAGQVATLTFRVTVDAGAVGQTIANSAQASSDQQKPAVTAGPVEPQPGGGTVQPDQALGIAKLAVDVNGETLKVGDEILYTVIVTNYLSIPQTGIVITDAVPAHTTYVAGSATLSVGSLASTNPLVANVGTLAAGKVATLTFRVTVDVGAGGQTIANSAQASSDQQKPAVTAGPVEPQPGGGTVQFSHGLYLPVIMRNL